MKMKKRNIYLFVTGDEDAAIWFESTFNIREFYKEMVKEGLKEKSVKVEGIQIDVKIKEFGEVDPEYERFVVDELCNEDHLRTHSLFWVDDYIESMS